jgi:hypothetical protein
MENNKTVAVYGDLTALYSARQNFNKMINYPRLDAAIKEFVGLGPEDKFTTSAFYTLFSDKKPAQVSFVTNLRSMGWNVKTVHPWEAGNCRPIDFRFSPDIAYALGTTVANFDRVLVISDAFDLVRPMNCFFNDDAECDIHLAFFGEAMDPKWRSVLRDPDCGITFHDLDVALYQ